MPNSTQLESEETRFLHLIDGDCGAATGGRITAPGSGWILEYCWVKRGSLYLLCIINTLLVVGQGGKQCEWREAF